MKPNLSLLLLLPILLAGCNDEYPVDPRAGLMGVDFFVEYDGIARGDDNDLYARYSFPTENETAWHRLSSVSSEEDSGRNSGGAYACFAREPGWEGKWWFEVALYEEIDGDFISRQRWDIDCLAYWIVIDERGSMELHEGSPPWDRPSGIPGLEASVLMALVFVATVVSCRKNR